MIDQANDLEMNGQAGAATGTSQLRVYDAGHTRPDQKSFPPHGQWAVCIGSGASQDWIKNSAFDFEPITAASRRQLSPE
jgi:hypothetical protein